MGRFQTLHKGHEQLINKALEVCSSVGIFIGSSQESGTRTNPFSYEVRRAMIESVFGDGVIIRPLPDIGVGNTRAWGDYVMTSAEENFGRIPDILISGMEGRRKAWLDRNSYPTVAELYIPKTIDISASRMRDYLIAGNREEWESFVSPAVAGLYEMLRKEALDSQENENTESV